jgi:hypothetical protein
MDSARVLDVLALARALVAAGWLQHAYHSPDDRYCIMGAVRYAGCQLDVDDQDLCLPRSLLNHVSWEAYDTPAPCFNDRRLTTQDQVRALFDAAAAQVGKQ